LYCQSTLPFYASLICTRLKNSRIDELGRRRRSILLICLFRDNLISKLYSQLCDILMGGV
jgi:hypothetical protein